MKLHYTKPKYYTMLNAVIVKALVDRLASTGLMLYVQSSSEDLKLATGIDRVEELGKYVTGFPIGEYTHYCEQDHMKVIFPTGEMVVDYAAVVAVSYAELKKFILPVKGSINSKPEGYVPPAGKASNVVAINRTIH